MDKYSVKSFKELLKKKRLASEKVRKENAKSQKKSDQAKMKSEQQAKRKSDQTKLKFEQAKNDQKPTGRMTKRISEIKGSKEASEKAFKPYRTKKSIAPLRTQLGSEQYSHRSNRSDRLFEGPLDPNARFDEFDKEYDRKLKMEKRLSNASNRRQKENK